MQSATVNEAYQQGRQAADTQQYPLNPYAQRDGELWQYSNQDSLYDAWQRGLYSVARHSWLNSADDLVLTYAVDRKPGFMNLCSVCGKVRCIEHSLANLGQAPQFETVD